MSALYAVAIFCKAAGFQAQEPENNEKPKRADADFVKSTAMEFGLGPVRLVQRGSGKELSLILVSDGGIDQALPQNWNKLSFDVKRFAVVWALNNSKESWVDRTVRWLSSYILRVIGMTLAGLNLWLIIACHAFGALKFAYEVFVQRHNVLTKQDAKALKIMKNLDAAIAYVKADPMNEALNIRPDRRIAALRKTASRLGIA